MKLKFFLCYSALIVLTLTEEFAFNLDNSCLLWGKADFVFVFVFVQ